MIGHRSSQPPSLYLTSVLRTLLHPTTEVPESLETVPQGPEPISGLLDRDKSTSEVGANSWETPTRRRGARGSGPGACFKSLSYKVHVMEV